MKKGDLLIVIVISLLILLINVSTKIIDDKEYDQIKVEVKVKGQLKKTFVLDSLASASYSIPLEGFNAVIIVEDNTVRMQKMEIENCPKQICSLTGKINKPSQSIVCLPNYLVVGLKGQTDSEIDAYSY